MRWLLPLLVAALTGCMAYHAEVPGVIDLRGMDAKDETTQRFQTVEYRFWGVYFGALTRARALDAIAEHLDEGRRVRNVKWESQFGIIDAAMLMPMNPLFQSRTLRVRGEVLPVPPVPPEGVTP